MKSFAAALLALTAYGSQTEASTQITTGATAEIESIALGLNRGPGYGYDLSTAEPSGHTQSFPFATREAIPTDLNFNSDGSLMYIVGGATTGGRVTAYELSAGYDLSTVTASDFPDQLPLDDQISLALFSIFVTLVSSLITSLKSPKSRIRNPHLPTISTFLQIR